MNIIIVFQTNNKKLIKPLSNISQHRSKSYNPFKIRYNNYSVNSGVAFKIAKVRIIRIRPFPNRLW